MSSVSWITVRGNLSDLQDEHKVFPWLQTLITRKLPGHHVVSGSLSRNYPPIWRVVANILNKQSRTADKWWSSSLRVGRGANNSSLWKPMFVTNHLQAKPRTWTDTLVRPKQRKRDKRFGNRNACIGQVHLRQQPIILGWIFRKWDVGIWTGLGWLRIETGGEQLWMR
jgi:hypothetical protein